jgi:phage terminase small subunit
VDRAWVMRKLVAIANVDHRKFSQTRVGCCRFCYGLDNLYQWTRGQFTWACNDALMNDKPGPELMGGLGYNKALPPLTDCPACLGEGEERVVMFDTRSLDEESAIAYLGSKKSKDKNEVMIADKVKAIELLGRAMGMWNDKMTLSAPGGGPVQHAHLHAHIATDAKELSEEQLEAFIKAELNKEILGVSAGVSDDQITIEATI